MHILHIVSSYPTKNLPVSSIFFQDQIMALSRAGIKEGIIFPELRSLRTLSLISLQENHFQQTIGTDEGIPIFRWHGWSPLPKQFRIKLFLNVTKKLVQNYIELYGLPDLIHAHNIRWAGVAANRIAIAYGLKYVITEHSSEHQNHLVSKPDKEIFRKAFLAASKVITVSSNLSKVLENEYDIIPPLTVPNVVDTNYFTLSPFRSLSNNVFNFCFIGRLHQNKNIGLLLKAFAIAFLKIEDARLLIGGGGVLRSELEELTRNLGIEHKVQFLGYLSREDVRSVLWKSDAFVLSSNVETFSVILIEALSTGLPVVATRCGGPEDFVIPEVGILVEKNDIQGFAEAMRRIYFAKHEYVSRAGKIRGYAKEKFGEPALVDRLVEVYKELIG